MADKPILLGRAAAERIKRAVIRVERMPYPTTDTKTRYPVFSAAPLTYADGIVVQPITPFNASSNTYGVGQVQPVIQNFNANTNTTSPINAGAVVLCYNFSVNSGTITNGTHIGMIQKNTTNGVVYGILWRDC